jgi:hypothetical protein
LCEDYKRHVKSNTKKRKLDESQLKNENIMKKIILGGIAAVVVAALAVVNVNMNAQSDDLLSDLALANVEALAQETGDCNNINGYRQFSNIGSGYGAYDCCYVWRSGQGSSNCKTN